MVEWFLKGKGKREKEKEFSLQSISSLFTLHSSLLCIFTSLHLCILGMPAFALELDTSIDDEIRKNYNPSKIDDDMNSLPPLPKILDIKDPPKSTTAAQKTVSTPIQSPNISPQISQKISNTVKKTADENFITIKKGTKIKLKLQNAVSDRTRKGTKVTFISQYPVSTTCFTIPTGTIFKGEIIHSHKPQLAGNGGLISIRINSLILNGETQPISAYVTKANHKRIFLNNIKGKRKYISSTLKSMKPSCHFFGKMMTVSKNLAYDGSSIVVAPFALSMGVLTLGGNAFVSPALGLFHKGCSISLPEDSSFEVKLKQDVIIYN